MEWGKGKVEMGLDADGFVLVKILEAILSLNLASL